MSELFIRDQDLKELRRLLRLHLPGVTAWAYGSRVNGRAHEASDLDVVLRTSDLRPIPIDQLAAFKAALSDSNIPILIDARDWAVLPDSFHDEIQKQHVVIRMR